MSFLGGGGVGGLQEFLGDSGFSDFSDFPKKKYDSLDHHHLTPPVDLIPSLDLHCQAHSWLSGVAVIQSEYIRGSFRFYL